MPETRREAILTAATKAIGDCGYAGFTIQDIARSCGLTKGGLLYHFKTKEDLLIAVLVEYERRMTAALRIMAERQSDVWRQAGPRDRALILLRGMVEQSAAEPELMRVFAVVQAEALHQAHPAHEHFVGLQDRIMAGLAMIVTGLTDEPDLAAREIYAMMMGLQYQCLRSEGAFDYVVEWDRVIAKLLPAEPGAGES